MPWVPFDYHNKQKEGKSEKSRVLPDVTKPALYNVHTIVTTVELFSRSVGGITLEKLYPYQRYKVRVAARNALGVGRFSSDVLVSNMEKQNI